MKKFSYIFLAVLLIITFMPAFANAVSYPAIPAPVDGGFLDLDCLRLSDGSLKNSSGCTSSYRPPATIGILILFVFSSAIWVGAFIALVSLMYTGAQFVFSGQNPSIRAAAKERLQNVVWGILILLFMVGVLNIINPALTNLRELTLKGSGCAQWNGNENKCKKEKKEGKRICTWINDGELCKEKVKDLGIPDPKYIPEEGDIPGTFSCTSECTIAENKCTKGFIADTARCEATECQTSDSIIHLCVKATYDCGIKGDPRAGGSCEVWEVENNRCLEAEGYKAEPEFCQSLPLNYCNNDTAKKISCTRILYFE